MVLWSGCDVQRLQLWFGKQGKFSCHIPHLLSISCRKSGGHVVNATVYILRKGPLSNTGRALFCCVGETLAPLGALYPIHSIQFYQELNFELRKLAYTFLTTQYMVINRILIDCVEPLGMQNGEIKDRQITASSVRGQEFAYYARLKGKNYWCAEAKSKTEYLQVDLGKVRFDSR